MVSFFIFCGMVFYFMDLSDYRYMSVSTTSVSTTRTATVG